MTGTRFANLSLTADQIVALRDEALAMPALMSGVLDAKITEIKAASEKLSEQQGIVLTLDAANKVKAEADETLVQAKRQAISIETAAAEMSHRASTAADAATKRTKAADDAAAAVATAQSKLEADQSALTEALKGMAALKAALDVRESVLEEREAKVAADQKKVNDRLETLKL